MENFINLFNILTYYPTGFFLFLFCLLSIYWIISIVGVVDQNLGFDLDIETEEVNYFTNLFITMGLSKVPLSIGLTFATFYGVFISGLLQIQGLGLLYNFTDNFSPWNLSYLILSTVIFIISFYSSLWLAGKTVKPMTSLFNEDNKSLNFEYIGSEGTVRSSTVTKTFGDVVILNKENEYVITVYLADYDDTKVVRGDKVRVILFNEETKRYLIQKI